MIDKYYELYEELTTISKDIFRYYDIDKIKPYAIYIWTKEDKNNLDGENVFDIEANRLVFYNKEHKIIEESLPIIHKIQSKLKEIDKVVKNIEIEY